MNQGVNSTGLGVSSLWLWLIPIVIGSLWVPVCSYGRLKAAIDEANDLAFDTLPRTNRPHKAEEAFTKDAIGTAPVFNYSRAFIWSLRAEEIARLYDDSGSRVTHRVYAHIVRLQQPDDDGVFGFLRQVYARLYGDCVREIIHQIYAHINRLQTHCGFPVQGNKKPMQPVPSGMQKRIFIASVLALGLQWGTTGSAVISIISMPAIGPGYRSIPFILYGVVSTMIWMAHLLSSYLAHYARTLQDGNAAPDPGFNSVSVAKGLATFLRRLSISAAGCNGLGIMISCTFQFTGFYDMNYCTSSVLGWGTQVAYSVAATDNSGHGQIKGGWIGGIVMTFGFSCFLYLTLVRSRATNYH